MIIDLRQYTKEVEAYVRAAVPLIERSSEAHLRAIISDLTMGMDTTTSFPWRTPTPIATKTATRYDRRDGRKDPIYVTLGFDALFSKVRGSRFDWVIERMVTHIKIYPENELANPALHLHIDKKEAAQLGPVVHLQVSENVTEAAARIALAVPRVPFGFVLPSDCLDFILSEFFPSEWGEAQSGAHAIQTLRQAQLKRAAEFARAVQGMWRGRPNRTPVNVLQDCFFPDIRLN